MSVERTTPVRMTSWVNEETGQVEERYELIKPLTNDKLEEIYKEFTMFNTPWAFARAIEKAHGIV